MLYHFYSQNIPVEQNITVLKIYALTFNLFSLPHRGMLWVDECREIYFRSVGTVFAFSPHYSTLR